MRMNTYELIKPVLEGTYRRKKRKTQSSIGDETIGEVRVMFYDGSICYKNQKSAVGASFPHSISTQSRKKKTKLSTRR